MDASLKRAFAVFTGRFGDFKPAEHNLLGAPIAERCWSPSGRQHVDRGVDGRECRWARILVFEPPTVWCSAGTWAPSGSGDRCGQTGEVEVRCLAKGPSARVELEHRHIDRHGPVATVRRQRRLEGWPLYLDSVCRPGQGKRLSRNRCPGLEKHTFQQAGRVLVINGRRVLLLQGFEPGPARPPVLVHHRRQPGRRREPRRPPPKMREEAGIEVGTTADLAGPVWQRRHRVHRFDGTSYQRKRSITSCMSARSPSAWHGLDESERENGDRLPLVEHLRTWPPSPASRSFRAELPDLVRALTSPRRPESGCAARSWRASVPAWKSTLRFSLITQQARSMPG